MALENARLYDEIRHQALHDGLTGLAEPGPVPRPGRARRRAQPGGRAARSRSCSSTSTTSRSSTTPMATPAATRSSRSPPRRRRGLLRPSDTAARLGGDEFAVLLEDVGDEADALSVAIRLADALRAADADSATPTVRDRRQHRRRPRRHGRRDRRRPAPQRRRRDVRGEGLVARRCRGLPPGPARRGRRAGATAPAASAASRQRGELRLDYQPIVELGDERGSSGSRRSSAGSRPTGPLLMPGEFIDLAEETGDIVPIGPVGPPRGLPPGARLADPARAARPPDQRQPVGPPVPRARPRRDGPGDPRRDRAAARRALILEITESGLMQRTAGDDRPARRAAGARRPPRDRRLRDRLLVAELPRALPGRHPQDRPLVHRRTSASGERPAIARAIVELGRTLGLEVVAEGIEHPTRPTGSSSLGCPLGQGYLFSRPLGVDAIEAFLAADATRRVQERRTSPTATLTSASRGPRRRGRVAAAPRLRASEPTRATGAGSERLQDHQPEDDERARRRRSRTAPRGGVCRAIAASSSSETGAGGGSSFWSIHRRAARPRCGARVVGRRHRVHRDDHDDEDDERGPEPGRPNQPSMIARGDPGDQQQQQADVEPAEAHPRQLEQRPAGGRLPSGGHRTP